MELFLFALIRTLVLFFHLLRCREKISKGKVCSGDQRTLGCLLLLQETQSGRNDLCPVRFKDMTSVSLRDIERKWPPAVTASRPGLFNFPWSP